MTGSTAASATSRPEWPRDVLEAAIAAAHAEGARVTAHTFGTDALPDLIGAGIDCIEHGTGLTEDLIGEMAARGTAVVPTLVNVENFPGFAAAGEQKFPSYAEHDAAAVRELGRRRPGRVRGRRAGVRRHRRRRRHRARPDRRRDPRAARRRDCRPRRRWRRRPGRRAPGWACPASRRAHRRTWSSSTPTRGRTWTCSPVPGSRSCAAASSPDVLAEAGGSSAGRCRRIERHPALE